MGHVEGLPFRSFDAEGGVAKPGEFDAFRV